jgi:glycosyltransferase involved in cell wall biosynthesis
MNVVECRVPVQPRNIVKAFLLLIQFWRGSHRADVMLVAEFNHALVPLAWLLSRLRNMPLLFDPGLSYYDEHVRRAKDVGRYSIYGIYLYWMERLAYHLPDKVIWFTPVDDEYFQELFHISPDRSAWLPPGIDTELFHQVPMPEFDSPFVIHWDGNMSPTHGVDIILQAAQKLASDPDIQFELIGKVHPDVKKIADAMHLPNVRWGGVVSDVELRSSIQRAHICLGAFRDDDKLRRSLYTKEIQAMISGRPLITGYGEAKSRLFKNGEHILMIPPENPQALADAIVLLHTNPHQRAVLAENSARAANKLCAVETAGRKLYDLVEEVYKQHSHH